MKIVTRLREIHRGTSSIAQVDRALSKTLPLFRVAAEICDFVSTANRAIVADIVETGGVRMSLALRLQVLAACAAFAFIGAIVVGAL